MRCAVIQFQRIQVRQHFLLSFLHHFCIEGTRNPRLTISWIKAVDASRSMRCWFLLVGCLGRRWYDPSSNYKTHIRLKTSFSLGKLHVTSSSQYLKRETGPTVVCSRESTSRIVCFRMQTDRKYILLIFWYFETWGSRPWESLDKAMQSRVCTAVQQHMR